MKEIVQELKKWREDRNMQNNEFVAEEQVAYMLDECKEILLAKTDEHRAEEYCDVAILAFNGLGLLGCEYEGSFCITGSCISAILDSLGSVLKTKVGWRLSTELNYIIKICDYEINELGYDFEKMMLEKIKVLHSRIQSPTQARDWAENGASGKWEKSTFPEHIAMVYKPDFEKCLFIEYALNVAEINE